MKLSIPAFKQYFLNGLICSLIGAGLVAAGTILFGEFNELAAKAFFTLAIVIIHSLLGLLFVSEDEKRSVSVQLPLFINVLFLFIFLSFFAALWGTWDLMGSEWIGRFYTLSFILVIAALHKEALAKTLKANKWIDGIVYVNYVFMTIVVLMLSVLILNETKLESFGEYYFRALGASAVIDGVLSLLAMVLFKLHHYKHPALKSKEPNKGLSIWVWLLIAYLFMQIIIPMFVFIAIGFAML